MKSRIVLVFKVVLMVSVFTLLNLNSVEASSANTKTIEGKVIDIYNDEEALESFITVSTASGNYVIDMTKEKSSRVLKINENIRVKVRNIKMNKGKYICEFVSF